MLLFILCADYFPDYYVFATQTIEAHHEACHQAGADITPDMSRMLEEKLLAVQARLQPAHRMLRRLHRAGAQVLAALWPSETIPRTPSRTADWLEVAVGRFEAWKASAARLGAERALEFVRAWYPGLNLDQLRTWRLEADEELAEVRPAIAQRASTIAECTNISVFAPEINDDGVARRRSGSGWTWRRVKTRQKRSSPATKAKTTKERKTNTSSRPVEQPASLSLTVPPATRRAQEHLLREAVIMPRFASRPLLQPALPSPPTCPTRQSLPWLNPSSLFFPACCLLNNFIKLVQFHPLGVYSNYVECWPFEGLLCKYYCVRVWFPFVYVFYP